MASTAAASAKSTPELNQPQMASSPPRHGSIPNEGRRTSLNLSPEVLERMMKRRTSIEKLQPEKLSPWMQVYDYPKVDMDKDSVAE